MVTLLQKLCGGTCPVEDELDQFQINDANVRKAVRNAIKRAPADDPVLIILWNDQLLAQAGGVGAKNTLLTVILGFPSCTAAEPASEEVFNFESTTELNQLWQRIRVQYPWAVGGIGQSIARTLVISDTKKKPNFMQWGLFGG